jgi:quinol monooxygenase YgiN
MYQDVDDENVISLVEEWVSQCDLERHIRSPNYRRLLAVMESSLEPPSVVFNTVSRAAGIEVIEAIRRDSRTNIGRS